MIEYFNHLGTSSPYYFAEGDQGVVFKSTFKDVVRSYAAPKRLDAVALLELLNKNFILGDRTMLSNVFRTPWMADWDIKKREWNFFNVPLHGLSKLSHTEIADRLFELLVEEVCMYIGERSQIGILLSGGMDSRIVAGVLNYIIINRLKTNLSVVALTWGVEDSRDVQYSRRIAKMLGWEWKHYIVNSEDLYNNIIEAAINGAEYSAFHLHALPQIRDDNQLDCVLAGSYGDSIGRAEYSGVHVSSLKPLTHRFGNFSNFLSSNAYSVVSNVCKEDISQYHDRYPRQMQYQQLELDYQLHYMRRMLNPCMHVLGDNMPVFQAFTSPKVFGFMWSLDPKLRNDFVYRFLMEKYMPQLLEVPWARTGIAYGEFVGVPDAFKKNHHRYPKLFACELHSEVEKMILQGALIDSGLLNRASVTCALKLTRDVYKGNFDYLERLASLASVSHMVDIYKFDVDIVAKSFRDNINGKYITPLLYKIKQAYRNR